MKKCLTWIRNNMFTVKELAGVAWAFPITLVGMLYVIVFEALGWYVYCGCYDCVAVWVCNKRIPKWLQRMWAGSFGHSVGNVAVLRYNPADPGVIPKTALKHAQVHARQCMRLGIFWPVLYCLCSFMIKLGCRRLDPIADNPLELDVRREIGNDVINNT